LEKIMLETMTLCEMMVRREIIALWRPKSLNIGRRLGKNLWQGTKVADWLKSVPSLDFDAPIQHR
jgi:hypothetical protein